jgi:dihydroorotate dehydrogenase electron transfer subunit
MAIPPSLFDLTCAVISHRQCGNGLFMLTLQPDQPVRFLPGQFVMIAMPDDRFLFRRPFSVMQQDPVTGQFDVFYKSVGLGTRLMVAHWSIGDTCQVLAPLGLPFPDITGPTLLIGGGIGIAPVYFAGLNNPDTLCLYGVRSAADLGILPELETAYGVMNTPSSRLHITTDDGSLGFHGHVGQWLIQHPDIVQNASAAYICGPTPMMKAVSQHLLATKPSMAVYVSMEEHMPCGIGACTGCVVARTHERLPIKTCVDGPVILAQDVDWDGTCWQPSVCPPETSCAEGAPA